MRHSPRQCPIALALVDKKLVDVRVCTNWAYFTKRGLFLMSVDFGAKLPSTAAAFIRAFDSGKDVEPFEFEIHPKKSK